METDYIYRQIIRETEKAFLVECRYDNRRDGCGLKFKWVAKSICGNIQDSALGKFVQVPTNILGNGVW